MNNEKTVPFIKIQDCGYYNEIRRPVKISNIQIHSDINDRTFKLKNEFDQKKLILDYIQEAIEHEADLVVLPELSTSKPICDDIYNKFLCTNKVIVMGSYINQSKQNVSEILIGRDRFKQIKNNPSKLEKDWMENGNEVTVFINTPIGDFAVLICYDATDFTILTSLQDFTDLIICIARNEDVGLFDHMFRALTYLKYQYIIFCNDGQYGGSCIYAPFHGSRKLDTMGVDNQGIFYREIDLDEIDKIRKDQCKSTKWKYPPASTKSRKDIYQKIEGKNDDMNNKLYNYMNCGYDILKEFLSIIYNGRACTKIMCNLPGIRCMYPSSLSDIAEKSCDFILNEYKKKLNNSTPQSYGKQYFLFELDYNASKDEHILNPENRLNLRHDNMELENNL